MASEDTGWDLDNPERTAAQAGLDSATPESQRNRPAEDTRERIARAIVGVDGVAWPPADAGVAEWALRRAEAVLAVVSPSHGMRNALERVREQAALEADDTPNGLIFSSIANEAERALSVSPSPVGTALSRVALMARRANTNIQIPSAGLGDKDLMSDETRALAEQAKGAFWGIEKVALFAAPPVGVDEGNQGITPEWRREIGTPGADQGAHAGRVVGVDEDAQEWTICDECHFVLYSSGMCHCSMEGKPGRHIVVIAKPSSAAPGVTEGALREGLRDASEQLFYAARTLAADGSMQNAQIAEDASRKAAALAVSPAPPKREHDLQGQPLCFVCNRRQSEHPGGVECVSPAPTEGPNCPECSTPLLPIREGDSERKWLCVRCRRAFAPTEGPGDA